MLSYMHVNQAEGGMGLFIVHISFQTLNLSMRTQIKGKVVLILLALLFSLKIDNIWTVCVVVDIFRVCDPVAQNIRTRKSLKDLLRSSYFVDTPCMTPTGPVYAPQLRPDTSQPGISDLETFMNFAKTESERKSYLGYHTVHIFTIGSYDS